MSPAIGYWQRWEQASYRWKPAIELMHAFGRDYPELFAPLEPLFAELRALRGVEVPPVEWLHATWLRLGFLGPDDIMWLHVETYYPAVAPRLRLVATHAMRLGGIELTDDGRVTLRVDDGGVFRDARRQAAIGLTKAHEALNRDPAMTPAGDTFVPTIDIAYLDATASEGAVAQAIDPYRARDLGEVTPRTLMLARLTIVEQAHYALMDVVAEIPMAGAPPPRGGLPS